MSTKENKEKEVLPSAPYVPVAPLDDYEEIELRILAIVHCEHIGDFSIARSSSCHIWEIMKLAQKEGISERKANKVIGYLKSKGYLMSVRGKPDEYTLSDPGAKYFEQLVNDRRKLLGLPPLDSCST